MIKKILLGLITTFGALLCGGQAMAIDGFLVSPTNQNVILTPGESTTLTIKVSNPSSATKNVNYEVNVSPFSVAKDSSDYTVDLSSKSDYTQITNWITIQNPTGAVAPNDSKIITFTIDVPRNAPAGGQYASINVSNVPDGAKEDDNVGVMEIMEISSLLYATVTGDTNTSGEIYDLSIPSFVFNPPVFANSMVKNKGNVHQTAEYILQVFPLFSDEEVFTNEEKPSEAIIIPEQTYFHSTQWTDAPQIGIFKVKQTVKFAGEEVSNEKIVFLCPLWLLAVIIFGVILIIIWLASKNKSRKKK